jgi:hypothetical protein
VKISERQRRHIENTVSQSDFASARSLNSGFLPTFLHLSGDKDYGNSSGTIGELA